MGRLIDADELLKHQIDTANYPSNFVKFAPTVEAIPKADYENRLKADMVAMLTELHLEIEEVKTQSGFDEAWDGAVKQCSEIIQQKINSLEEA